MFSFRREKRTREGERSNRTECGTPLTDNGDFPSGVLMQLDDVLWEIAVLHCSWATKKNTTHNFVLIPIERKFDPRQGLDGKPSVSGFTSIQFLILVVANNVTGDSALEHEANVKEDIEYLDSVLSIGLIHVCPPTKTLNSRRSSVDQIR